MIVNGPLDWTDRYVGCEEATQLGLSILQSQEDLLGSESMGRVISSEAQNLKSLLSGDGTAEDGAYLKEVVHWRACL